MTKTYDSHGNSLYACFHFSGNLKLERIKFQASAYLFRFIDQWAPRNVARAPNFLF